MIEKTVLQCIYIIQYNNKRDKIGYILIWKKKKKKKGAKDKDILTTKH